MNIEHYTVRYTSKDVPDKRVVFTDLQSATDYILNLPDADEDDGEGATAIMSMKLDGLDIDIAYLLHNKLSLQSGWEELWREQHIICYRKLQPVTILKSVGFIVVILIIFYLIFR